MLKIRRMLYALLFLRYIGKSKDFYFKNGYLYDDPKKLFLLDKNYKIVATASKIKGKINPNVIRNLFKSC